MWIKIESNLFNSTKVAAIVDYLVNTPGWLDWLECQLFGGDPLEEPIEGDSASSEDRHERHVTRARASRSRHAACARAVTARHAAPRSRRDGFVTARDDLLRNYIVGTLSKCWLAAREIGKLVGADLQISKCDFDRFDRTISGCPGFAEAMASVGWAEEIEGEIVILPNFTKNNHGMPKSSAERSRKYRERKKMEQENGVEPDQEKVKIPKTEKRDGFRDAPSRTNVTRVTLIEKSREEKKGGELNSPPNPPSFTPATSRSTGEPKTMPVVVMEFACTGDPPIWQLTEEKLAEWVELWEGEGKNEPGWVLAEFRKARQWLQDNRKKTSRGMTRFLGSWLSRANDGPRNGMSRTDHSTGRKTFGEIMDQEGS